MTFDSGFQTDWERIAVLGNDVGEMIGHNEYSQETVDVVKNHAREAIMHELKLEDRDYQLKIMKRNKKITDALIKKALKDEVTKNENKSQTSTV